MYHLIYDAASGSEQYVEVSGTIDSSLLNEYKNAKLAELMNLYESILVQGFTSSATGTPVFFTYSPTDQLNYSKIANLFAIDANKTSAQIGTPSGVVTLTRDQFLVFVQDAEAYEMGLYTKRKTLEAQITAETDVNVVSNMFISLT